MKSIITLLMLVCFLATSVIGPIPVYANEFTLPKPGVMVHLSPPLNAPMLKGIKVHTDNPFRFDFILDQGDSVGEGRDRNLQDESMKLVKYFLASLTIPEGDLWVNLSPYEKNRIIPNSFGLTEMGRDLLAQDYMLKQITASLIYPEDEIGKKFWKRIYEEAAKKYNTNNIPVNTFNKVWIIPEKAVVYENAKAGTAYVVESKLKVMLEQDYLSLEKNNTTVRNDTNTLGSQIIRQIVLPELEREVNEGKNFTQLRQVYNSLILATWYKKKIKDSILAQVYTDKNKVEGVKYDTSVILSEADPSIAAFPQNDTELIYQRYLQAFKKGVYNFIKEEIDPVTQQAMPKKYFSGGANLLLHPDKALIVIQDSAVIAPGTMDSAMNIAVQIDPASSAKADNLIEPSFGNVETEVDADSDADAALLSFFSKKSVLSRAYDPSVREDIDPRIVEAQLAPKEEKFIKLIEQRARNRGVAINQARLDAQTAAFRKHIPHRTQEYRQMAEDERIIGPGVKLFENIYTEVKEIFDQILESNGYNSSDFELYLVDDSRPNAFATIYDNKVFISLGLIRECMAKVVSKDKGFSKNALAFIIGHEIEHLFQWVDDLINGKMPELKTNFKAWVISNHPDEYDSDLQSLKMMHKAGYGILEAPVVFHVFGDDFPLLKMVADVIHPPIHDRLRKLNGYINKGYWKGYKKEPVYFSEQAQREVQVKTRHREFRDLVDGISSKGDLEKMIEEAKTEEELLSAMTKGYKNIFKGETLILTRKHVFYRNVWSQFKTKLSGLVGKDTIEYFTLLRAALLFHYEICQMETPGRLTENMERYVTEINWISMQIQRITKDDPNKILQFVEKAAQKEYRSFWHEQASDAFAHLDGELGNLTAFLSEPQIIRLFKAMARFGTSHKAYYDQINRHLAIIDFGNTLKPDTLEDWFSVFDQLTKLEEEEKLFKTLINKLSQWMADVSLDSMPQIKRWLLSNQGNIHLKNKLIIALLDGQRITESEIHEKMSDVTFMTEYLQHQIRQSRDQDQVKVLILQLLNLHTSSVGQYKNDHIRPRNLETDLDYHALFLKLFQVNKAKAVANPILLSLQEFIDAGGILDPQMIKSLDNSTDNNVKSHTGEDGETYDVGESDISAASAEQLEEIIHYLQAHQPRITDRISFETEHDPQMFWAQFLNPLSVACYFKKHQLAARWPLRTMFGDELRNSSAQQMLEFSIFGSTRHLTRINLRGVNAGVDPAAEEMKQLQEWFVNVDSARSLEDKVNEIVSIFAPSVMRNHILFLLLLDKLRKMGIYEGLSAYHEEALESALRSIQDRLKNQDGDALTALGLIQSICSHLVADDLMDQFNLLDIVYVLRASYPQFSNDMIRDLAQDRRPKPLNRREYEEGRPNYEDVRFMNIGGSASQINLFIPTLVVKYLEDFIASTNTDKSFQEKVAMLVSFFQSGSGQRDQLLDKLLHYEKEAQTLTSQQILEILPLFKNIGVRDQWALYGLEQIRQSKNNFIADATKKDDPDEDMKNLKEELEEVKRFFPEFSYNRDDIFEDVKERWAHTPELLNEINPLILQHPESMRQETQKKVIFAEGRLLAFLEERSPEDRADFLLWLMGGEKPEWIINFEFQYGVNVDHLKDTFHSSADLYKGFGKSFKRKVAEQLIFGKTTNWQNGFNAEGVLENERSKKKLLEGLFQFASNKSSEIAGDPIYRDAYDSIFKNADPEKQGEIVLALFEIFTTLDEKSLNNRNAILGAFLQALGAYGVKIGQALEIDNLRDRANPIPRELIFDLIAQVYGDFHKRFRGIYERVGNASVKNVLRVIGINRNERVLKVKRPEIEKTIEKDYLLFLAVLKDLQAKGHPVLVELALRFKKMLYDELDFPGENTNQRTLALNILNRGQPQAGFIKRWKYKRIKPILDRLFASSALPVTFQVPIADHVEEDLMLEAKVPSPIKLSDMSDKELAGQVRVGLRNELIEQIFIDGVYHLDPQPANILVGIDGDGVIANLIDTGAIGHMSDFNKIRLMLIYKAVEAKGTKTIIGLLAPQMILDPQLNNDITKALESLDTTAIKIFKILSLLNKKKVGLNDDFLGLIRFFAAGKYLFEEDKASISIDVAKDAAMIENNFDRLPEVLSKKGGIDFNSDKMNLQTRNEGGEIKFKFDPAMLEKLQNAPGFVPVIISIQPLQNLRLFLGLNKENPATISA